MTDQSRTPALAAALRDLASRERPLLATDFDGVLAPLVKDPDAVRPLPGTIEALRSLAGSGATVAVVSGRDLATLRRLTGLPGDGVDPVVLIGSHGAESSDPQVRDAMAGAAVTSADLERLEHLATILSEVVAAHPGTRTERKAAAVVLHTRGLPDDVADAAMTAAVAAIGTIPQVRVIQGKAIVEFSVSHADKGSAVLALAVARDSRGRLYLGDDTTDEDVFVRLDDPADVTVKVGEGATAARHRVADPPEVAGLLIDLAGFRGTSPSE